MASRNKLNNPRKIPRVPTPAVYASVPQSMTAASHASTQNNAHLAPPGGPSRSNTRSSKHSSVTHGVATGHIGGGFGPYAYHPNNAPLQPPSQRNHSYQQHQNPPLNRVSSQQPPPDEATTPSPTEKRLPRVQATTTVPATYMWERDPDIDDALHNYDPKRDRNLSSFTLFSARGWINTIVLVGIVLGLMVLFAGYPIISFYQRRELTAIGFNLGGINGTGQIPNLPNMPMLIDSQTPSSAYSRTGWDGKKYNLVFSDEFETDGRTFWPGDDPFWEAQDIYYWPTADLEWYSPQAITTQDGKLVITMDEMAINNLNFRSGMLSTWNKFCFTTGYIEVSISLPGSAEAAGFWPAAWTMGNLGRAGYGSTTEGMWPYTYDSCDIGTFPNQTNKNLTPEAVVTGAPDGGPLSYLPGQRLSACTCPGSDHPGPTDSTGRGVPEIDIIESQINVFTSPYQGQASQSLQMAPYNYQYTYTNTTPATTIYNSEQTYLNTYTGGVYQQAVSAVSNINNENYGGSSYGTYGFEWWSNPNDRQEGYVTWFSDGNETWTATAASLAGDSSTGISSRLISEEPMYIILNLGMAPSFQEQDFKHLQFPAQMYVDYVRVYQRDGVKNSVTCDPSSHPTASYINNHLNAYSNPNWTTWASAGYSFPRNSLYDGC